jgi:hypothetical protein
MTSSTACTTSAAFASLEDFFLSFDGGITFASVDLAFFFAMFDVDTTEGCIRR